MEKANPEGQKWPSSKRDYDIGYLRAYGMRCPECHGYGFMNADRMKIKDCKRCDGIGYIPKPKETNNA